MGIRFTKMHGLGNDYIYVNLAARTINNEPDFARRISDRHFGVGSDGLILIGPPEPNADAHVRMRMYNADGSNSETCGNGLRCLATLVYERGIARHNPLRVQTDAGVTPVELRVNAEDRVESAVVDFGPPRLTPNEIPTTLSGGSGSGGEPAVIDAALDVAGTPHQVTCVSFGNPHVVTFVPQAIAVSLARLGPAMATHAVFPRGVNAHWAQVLDAEHVDMVTWERGSGPTLACGSGAAAVCVAGVLNGLTSRKITAKLPGGELDVEWSEATNHVTVRGPAVAVCDGEWLLDA